MDQSPRSFYCAIVITTDSPVIVATGQLLPSRAVLSGVYGARELQFIQTEVCCWCKVHIGFLRLSARIKNVKMYLLVLIIY